MLLQESQLERLYGLNATPRGRAALRLIRLALPRQLQRERANRRIGQQFRFQSPLSALGGGEVEYFEPLDSAATSAGDANPTPECRRIMNGWMSACVFGKAPEESLLQLSSRRGDEVAGLDGFENAAGLAEPTPECQNAMAGWMGKCVFSYTADHEAVHEKPSAEPSPSSEPTATATASPSSTPSPSESAEPTPSSTPSAGPAAPSATPSPDGEPKDCMCHMLKTLGRRMKEGLKMGVKHCDRAMCAAHALGMAKDSRERRSACVEVCKKQLKPKVEQNCKTIVC